MTDHDLLLEAIALATQAGRDAAAALASTTRPGVVVSVDPTNTTAMVQPDGPEGADGSTHGAAVICPVTLRIGDRVMLRYDGSSPRATVVGRRSGDWDYWHTIGDDGEPPFTSAWHHTAGTTFPGQNGPAQLMFTTRSGRLELRGSVTRDVPGAGGNDIFTLPEYAWPDNDLLLRASGALGSSTVISVDQATGQLSALAGDDTVVLDGISFITRIQAQAD